ncbi:MAG TPA: nitroreductase [Cyclobacteriaceae bacterium]
MKFNTEAINLLIKSRRSVFPKDYLQDEKVDDHIVNQLLENANWAPSHKLTEPWRFVVFSNDGLFKLAEFQADCYKRVTEKDGSFREERYQNLKTKPLQSSHIIAIGMKRDPEKRVPEIEEIGAVFCAVQNMYLTATAYGIGCYLSTGGVTYFEGAKEFFGWGKEDKLIGFLNMGVSKSEPLSGKRRPVEEKVRWIS